MKAELTPQERRIAKLLAEGLTNAEIAKRLGVSVRTVEWNLTRVYRRLGLRSRAQLAVHVAGNHWVREDTE